VSLATSPGQVTLARQVPFTCEVEIVDDRGKHHVGCVKDLHYETSR
jgi:hypothetical protein